MMTKTSSTVAVCATLLCAGTALAMPTAQEKCDNARITAWKVYVTCVESQVAKDAKGVVFDEFAAFAKCRHSYFKKWTAFQTNASLATSTCIGSRLTDNGTTVTDNLTGLVWEKKDNLDSTPNLGDPHDADNTYTWSTGSNNEDGTAFTTFLTDAATGLNVTGFAGANGWRLPTMAELQTTLSDFKCTGAGFSSTCTCGFGPCIDVTFGPTAFCADWSATSYVPDPGKAWWVGFSDAEVSAIDSGTLKTFSLCVRAVRGGL
jgi:hypothetical protein